MHIVQRMHKEIRPKTLYAQTVKCFHENSVDYLLQNNVNSWIQMYGIGHFKSCTKSEYILIILYYGFVDKK